MNLALDTVVQDFIVSNGKIAQSYFDLSGKIIDSLCESHSAPEAVLLRLIEQAQLVTSQYLEAHQQVVQSLYLNHQDLAAGRREAPPLSVTPLRVVAATPLPDAPAEAPGYEAWLREEISAMSGIPAADIDLRQRFDEMGLDSLSRVNLFDALGQAFPETRAHAEHFFDLQSPGEVLAQLGSAPAAAPVDVAGQVLALLAELTGFDAAELDPSQPYEEQGLDSLIRLDFLDLVTRQWPTLKPHESELSEAVCAQQTIAQVTRLLADGPRADAAGESPVAPDERLREAVAPLLAEQGADASRPFAELGLTGFDRAALCERMASTCSTSAFAGEALMSRRSPEDAAALLGRMG